MLLLPLWYCTKENVIGTTADQPLMPCRQFFALDGNPGSISNEQVSAVVGKRTLQYINIKKYLPHPSHHACA